MSWAKNILADVPETDVVVTLVWVNEGPEVRPQWHKPKLEYVVASLPFTYAIPTSTLAEAGARVEVGEGGEAPATLVSAGASLTLTFTIPALASVKAGARVGVGGGGEALATLVSTGASLPFTNAIPALVLTEASVEARERTNATWELEGVSLSLCI